MYASPHDILYKSILHIVYDASVKTSTPPLMKKQMTTFNTASSAVQHNLNMTHGREESAVRKHSNRRSRFYSIQSNKEWKLGTICRCKQDWKPFDFYRMMMIPAKAAIPASKLSTSFSDLSPWSIHFLGLNCVPWGLLNAELKARFSTLSSEVEHLLILRLRNSLMN